MRHRPFGMFILVLLIQCGGQAGQPPSAKKGASMVSEINQFDQIALLDIHTSDALPWQTDPENALNERRAVVLYARVVESFKGDVLRDDTAALVPVNVTQRQPLSGRLADDYGPWSALDLDAKPRILVFFRGSPGAQDSCGDLGSDENIVVDLADPNRPHADTDTRLAMSLCEQFEDNRVALTPDVRDTIWQHRRELGPLMGRFLWDAASSDVQGDEAYLQKLIAAPEIPPLFRAVLLDRLMEELQMSDSPDEQRRIRLLRSMISILREPASQAKVLHESIVQAYIRAVVLDSNNDPYFSAGTVFDGAERDSVASLLASFSFTPELEAQLDRWLKN